MKKTRFLALVIVIAMTLVGAGYAWWTDTLVVKSTVETGTLDVQFKDYPDLMVDEESEYLEVVDPDYGEKEVAFTVKNMYPGAQYRTVFTQENVGSIPAKLESVEVKVNGSNAVKESFYVKDTIVYAYKDHGEAWGSGTYRELFRIPRTQIANFESVLNQEFQSSDVVLEPDELVVWGWGPWGPYPAGSDHEAVKNVSIFELSGEEAGNNTQDKEINFNIKFNWTQFNKPAATPAEQ